MRCSRSALLVAMSLGMLPTAPGEAIVMPPGALSAAAPPADVLFPCVQDSETLCLNHQRFEVTASFTASSADFGEAQVVRLTDDTGYLWFFSPDNVEIVVKVLDGCAINGHYWVFAGGLTNVDDCLRVTDTQTGGFTLYCNRPDTPFQPVQDTSAFPNCP
jgi:hypothetical protein